MKMKAGINGFGRFGQHLLKYWLERDDSCSFIISHINDDTLNLSQIIELIQSDKYLDFSAFNMRVNSQGFTITGHSKRSYHIIFSHSPSTSIPWIGYPDLFFESSGKNTDANKCKHFLKKRTKVVLISATSHNAHKTLIYGFNHNQYSQNKHKIVSYGSCTVNAFVPLANYINSLYSINNCDVHIVHNIPNHKLHMYKSITRNRCSLETSGPKLLNFLTPDNFYVSYILVPDTGVSIFDYRFHVQKATSKEKFVQNLQHAIRNGVLKNIYGMDSIDRGAHSYKFSTYSSVIVKNLIKVTGNDIYISSYFDNENSVNRYYDLASYIAHSFERDEN